MKGSSSGDGVSKIPPPVHIERRQFAQHVHLETPHPMIRSSMRRRIGVDNLLCPICCKLFDTPMILECGHSFCKSCLQDDEDVSCVTCGATTFQVISNDTLHRICEEQRNKSCLKVRINDTERQSTVEVCGESSKEDCNDKEGPEDMSDEERDDLEPVPFRRSRPVRRSDRTDVTPKGTKNEPNDGQDGNRRSFLRRSLQYIKKNAVLRVFSTKDKTDTIEEKLLITSRESMKKKSMGKGKICGIDDREFGRHVLSSLFRVQVRCKSLSNIMFSTIPSSSEGSVSSAGMDLQCSVCMQLYNTPVMLPCCGHSFCDGCASMWLAKRDSCPTCRTRTSHSQPIRNIALQQVVDEHRRSLERSKKRAAAKRSPQIDLNTAFAFPRETGVRQSVRRTKVGPSKTPGSRCSSSSARSICSSSLSIMTQRLQEEEDENDERPIGDSEPSNPATPTERQTLRNNVATCSSLFETHTSTFQRGALNRRSEMVRPTVKQSVFARNNIVRRSMNMLRRLKVSATSKPARVEQSAFPAQAVRRSAITPISVDPEAFPSAHRPLWKRLFGKKRRTIEAHVVPSGSTAIADTASLGLQAPDFGGLVYTGEGGVIKFGRGKELVVALVGGRRVGKTSMLNALPNKLSVKERKELSGQADSIPDCVVSQAIVLNGAIRGVIDYIEIDAEDERLLSSAASICDVALCVFSVSDPAAMLSVMSIARNMKFFRKSAGVASKCPYVLVGSNPALPYREISQSSAEKTAKQLNGKYVEVNPCEAEALNKVIRDLVVVNYDMS